MADSGTGVIAPGRKHVLVREYVRDLIAGLPAGAAAPSERELTQRFGVARMTVRQAVDALVVEGILERVPGRGTFVSRPRPRAGRLASFSEHLRSRGVLPGSRTLLVRREQAGPGVARALDVFEGDSVIHWRRLRTGNDLPVAVEDVYLNEVLLPGFIQLGLPDSLWDALRARGLGPTWGENSVTAEGATREEAEQLELEPGSPVLRVSQRVVSGSVVVEVSRSAFRSDRYTLWVQVGRAD